MLYNISAKVVSFLTIDSSNRTTALYVNANTLTLRFRVYIVQHIEIVRFLCFEISYSQMLHLINNI